MKKQILQESKNMLEELVSWRHCLHQIPELGLRLPDTTAFVREKLVIWTVSRCVKNPANPLLLKTDVCTPAAMICIPRYY